MLIINSVYSSLRNIFVFTYVVIYSSVYELYLYCCVTFFFVSGLKFVA